MKKQEVEDFITLESKNPPKTREEFLERLSRVLRMLDLVLPNHTWNFSDIWVGDMRKELVDTFRLRPTGVTVEDFETNFARSRYHECGTVGCAIGVARLLWGVGNVQQHTTVHMFNRLEGDIAMFITGCSRGDVTATDVADRIDRYLRGEPILPE